jgi:uncharacterized protein (TIGR03067 family)
MSTRHQWIFTFVAMALLLGIPTSGFSADSVDANELEKLQGKWAPISAMFDGMEVKLDDGSSFSFHLKGRTATVHLRGEVAGTLEIQHLDVKKPFGEIDFERDYLGEKSKIKLLYKLEGNTITTCAGLPNADRPSELASRPGSKTRLTVSKITKQ